MVSSRSAYYTFASAEIKLIVASESFAKLSGVTVNPPDRALDTGLRGYSIKCGTLTT